MQSPHGFGTAWADLAHPTSIWKRLLLYTPTAMTWWVREHPGWDGQLRWHGDEVSPGQAFSPTKASSKPSVIPKDQNDVLVCAGFAAGVV